jgi:hypothetical protein
MRNSFNQRLAAKIQQRLVATHPPRRPANQNETFDIEHQLS